ncbi:hypothetical protein AX14_013638 [Amanita brunnescens Koide BX004]|nr:hypothetical protein AX14_013638 [Amanita brunnescens Koide BX004]
MQSQQYNMPPPSGYYNAQNPYPTSQDQHIASNAGDFTSFSRGSSLVYPQDYQYFPDRGTPTRHSPNFPDTHSIDATVSRYAGNSAPGVDMGYRPEDIMAYQQPWRWNDASVHDPSVPVSTPMYSNADAVKNSLDYHFDATGAVTQLPTPAMAIMLSHNSQSDVRHPLASYQIPSSQVSAQTSATAARPGRTESGAGIHIVPDSQSREKKHACTMCHKRRVKILVFRRRTKFTNRTCADQVRSPKHAAKALPRSYRRKR